MAAYNPGTGFIKISSRYGDPRTKTGGSGFYGHEGDDWAADLGTPIPAAADGEVSFVAWDKNGYGHYIVLKHTDNKNNEVLTIYAQMRQKSTLAPKALVKKGDIVGYVGMTGETARGAHLHFEIRLGDFYNRNIVDPSTYDLSQLKNLEAQDQNGSTANTNEQASTSEQANTTISNNTADEPAIESYCTPTACTEDQFIVQIMGENHPEGQRIVLLDDKNNEIKFDSQENIKNSLQTLSSNLKQWDWNKLASKKGNLKAYLEIATMSGKPIRLLISEQIEQTEKQLDKQYNQIIPIIPLTPLYSSNYKTNPSEIRVDPYEPVHVREGWFYIFKDNKLWRELEIRRTTSGYTYHDVQVKNHRAEDGKFKDDKRPAVGKDLKEIWIPACWNNTDITDNGFFYSEVQLSKERINYLETKNERAQPMSMQATAKSFKQLIDGMKITRQNLGQLVLFQAMLLTDASRQAQQRVIQNRKDLINHVFPLSLTSPQRTRFELYEWLFDHPVQYVCDTQGQYTNECLEEARKYVKSYTDSNNPYPKVFDRALGTPTNRRNPNSQVAVGVALEEVLVPKRKQAIAKASLKLNTKALEAEADQKLQDLLKIWEAKPAEEDILKDARDRKIIGLMVQDPLYRMRQLQSQLNAAQNTINLAAELATYQKNHGSAVLIENIILPGTINGNKNDLRQAYNSVSDRVSKKDIDYATALGLRDPAKQAYNYALRLFIREYKKESNYPVLADICSLNGFDYAGGLYFISKLATTLAAQVYDPISIEMQQGEYNKAAIQALINTLDDEKHPLSLFIWKKTATASDLTKPHTAQPLEENKGDGLCRPTELIRVQGLESNKVMADTQFLESKLLADWATKESSSRTGLKAVGAAVLEVYSKIVESVATAQTSYHQSRIAAAQTASELRTNRSNQNTAQQDINTNTQQQQTNTAAGQAIEREQQRVDGEITQNTDQQTNQRTQRGEYEQIGTESRQNAEHTRTTTNAEIQNRRPTVQVLQQTAADQRAAVLADARQSVMRLYQQAGNQLRQVHLDFYPLILERTGNVNINEYFVLLWDNMDELRPRILQNVNGRLMGPDGTTHAVTNIQEARTNGFTPAKSNQVLWMLPRTPATENIILNYFVAEEAATNARHALNDVVSEGLSQIQAWRLMAQDADNEVRNIDRNLADLNTEQIRLQTEKQHYQNLYNQNQIDQATLRAEHQRLDAELTRLEAERVTLRGRYQAQQQNRTTARQHLESQNRLSARTTAVPGILLALEAYNLFTESRNLSSTFEQKGPWRGIFTIGAAGLDFMIAADALAERIRNAQAGRVLAYYSTSSTYLAQKIGAGSVIMRLLPSLTIRLLAQTVSSGIFGALSLLDAYDTGRAGNPAAWGHLLIATGCGISLVSGVLAAMAGGSASAVAASAMLGPAGWAALILIVAGAAWITYFNHNDIQAWLINGPFGLPATDYGDKFGELFKSDTAYDYLKEEAEAYYFLLSLLSNSHVTVKNNPYQQLAKDKITQLQQHGIKIEEGLIKLANANLQVEVTSGFAGLVIEKDLHQEIRAKFIQLDYNSSYTPNMSWRMNTRGNTTVLQDNINYLLKETTVTGTTYYYQIDKLGSQQLSGDNLRSQHRKYALPVRVQLAMNIVTSEQKNATTEPKQSNIAQYQWFFPAPTLVADRKPQPTNQEPKFIIGENEDYWLRDKTQEDI